MIEKMHYSVQIFGIVQGVGMRPFIYKAAKAFNLTGYVKNLGSCVSVEITGSRNNIKKFFYLVLHNPPPSSRIEKIYVHFLDNDDCDDFVILDSSDNDNQHGMLMPDLAICDDCVKDIKNDKGRRHHYAFTSCTNCGPRYSILKDLPYDRQNTSMNPFEMCSRCQKEFEDTYNRRFHAQPNCCPDCGPEFRLLDRNGDLIACTSPIEKTKELIRQGKIVGIKGIGGFHLVCNAQNNDSVKLLRVRKKRPDKPFAIMVGNLSAVKKICYTNYTENDILTGSIRPIVLLKRNENDVIAKSVAPKLNRFGVMLPYSPLHFLLFDKTIQYLVMTSGNISGMPICYKDSDALENLNDIVDCFLIHNREIMTPVDDSVVKAIDDEILISRCGRGYAPIALSIETDYEILALGGEQKSTFCVLRKGYAHLSQCLGELGNTDSFKEYAKASNRLLRLLKATPEYIAHDLHTGYSSTQLAAHMNKIKIPIQHHWAHMAGCLCENGVKGDSIGVIFDGTGLGTDSAIWGGEFLVKSDNMVKRAGHLQYVSIQGGEQAIKEPWRCAVSYLFSLGIDSSQFFPQIESESIKVIEKAIENNINCFASSSMGRLFDCVATLALHKPYITYDAQAAIELESIIDSNIEDEYDYSVKNDFEQTLILEYKSIIEGVVEDIKCGVPANTVSAKFHNTICSAVVDCVCKLSCMYNTKDIALGGGVFENTYLLVRLKKKLEEKRFRVFYNKKVPLNDGGLSFGQVCAATEILKEGVYVPGSTGKSYICS